jgi:hypothetical protein
MGTRLPVPDWPSGSSLTVTTSAVVDQGVFKPGQYPLKHATPLRLLVPLRRRGTITFDINIVAELPYKDVFRAWPLPLRHALQFECDSEGNVFAYKKQTIDNDWATPFNMLVDFHTWQDNRLGWPSGYLKAPPEIRVLHIAMDVEFDLIDKWGHHIVTHYDHGDSTFGVPERSSPGSTDKRSASLGRMVVELVQPVSKIQGVSAWVHFGIDRSDIEASEGALFNRFIRESLSDLYEVRVALESGLLQFRGEARASATYKGSPGDRARHNLQLSEKRKKAVVDWMQKEQVRNALPNLIQAIGDTKAAKAGEEDRNERRCSVYIKGEELTWVVQQLWLANRYLGR